MTVLVSITFSVPSQLSNSRFQITKYKFSSMLVYFKHTQGITQEIDVKPEETMKEFVARAGQLGSIEKVEINMIQYSCICNNDQLLKELDAKINILTKLLDKNILRKFSDTPSQNNIIDRLTRQPSNNLENLQESSPPLCQDLNTPMLNRDISVNRLEKENAMKIAQNKKINDQLMEIRKTSSKVHAKLQHGNY